MDIVAALDLYGLTRADLAFRGSYRSQHFLDNWLSARPQPHDGWQLKSTTWLDGRVLGGPLPPQIVELDLDLDRDGQPLQVVRRTGGKSMTVDFSTGSALLPDGSRHSVPAKGVQHILENNHPGLVALLIALAPFVSDGEAATVFLVSALTAIPYRLALQTDGRLLSDFGETLRCDVQGRLVQIEAADGAVVIDRADPAPPRPDLIGKAPAQAPAYLAPPTLAPRMQEIEIEVAGRGSLAATFTRPTYLGAVGVLVLQGSGDVDRHGFASGVDTGTATFSDALAEQGLAVLRFDKRGVGHSRRADDSLSGEGFRGALDDADAALAALRARIATDAPIILMGHSLGGLAALALSVERYAGALPLVLLAVPGRPLAQLIRAQTLDQGRSLGLSEAALSRQLEELEYFFAYARGDISGEDVRASAMAGRLAKAFMADLAELDPAALMRRQRAAVCLLQGGRDVQVDSTLDFALLRMVGEQTGVSLQARLFPRLNHLFRPVEEGEGLAGYARGGAVDADAVGFVVDWCRARGATGRP